ncbi:MAG: MFS transporter [Gammaproteobacteria bacterium]|nr:MFS transporter [Gammaproteobacteria bacterium]MDE0364958.1 MFS transporter [Gammaproteobacteria bacterium]
MLAQVVSFIDRQVITLLVQPIRADLAISDTQISLLMGFAFVIFYVAMGVPIARLSDRYSRRTIIATGIFLWSLATAACGLARNFWQLFLARIGVGVGEATLTPAAYSMIADYFPKAILGRAIGLYAVGVYLGAGLALVLGGAAIRAISASGPVDLPVFGTLAPWQLTFIVVAVPGLLMVLLMRFTVREPVRRNLAAAREKSIPVREVAAFLWLNRGTFGSIFFGYATGGMAIYGFLFWIPEFLRRSHGWDISDAGIVFGTQLMLLGTAGTYAGGWSCDWLTARGYRDAALRSLAAFFAIAMPFMAITPLVPEADLAIPMLGLAVLTLSLQQGLSPVAINLITPNQMRAQVVAVFFVVSTFSAIAFGATSVAVVTDYVFRDENDLRYSLSIVFSITLSLAAVGLALGIKPYRASLERAAAWSESSGNR